MSTSPEDLANDLEECRYYFDRLDSPSLGWSFTVNHAHLLPQGVAGFLDAIGVENTENNRRDYRELLFRTTDAVASKMPRLVMRRDLS